MSSALRTAAAANRLFASSRALLSAATRTRSTCVASRLQFSAQRPAAAAAVAVAAAAATLDAPVRRQFSSSTLQRQRETTSDKQNHLFSAYNIARTINIDECVNRIVASLPQVTVLEKSARTVIVQLTPPGDQAAANASMSNDASQVDDEPLQGNVELNSVEESAAGDAVPASAANLAPKPAPGAAAPAAGTGAGATAAGTATASLPVVPGKQNPLKNINVNPRVTGNQEQFMVLYSFGTVAFINVPEPEQERWLQRLRSSSAVLQPAPQHAEAYDDIQVVVNSNLKEWCRLGQNVLVVRVLDLYNINVVASILARSVALKSYEIKVQQILQEFRRLNEMVQQRQPTAKRTDLIPNIAQGNALRCDLLLNVRLFDRLQISWEYDNYDYIYDELVREFEIGQRYERLEQKLNFISDNTQFYMELRHASQAHLAEWIIIALITSELLFAMYMHYGAGSPHNVTELASSQAAAAAAEQQIRQAATAAAVAAVEAVLQKQQQQQAASGKLE